MAAAAQDDAAAGGVARAPGGDALVEAMRNTLVANGVDPVDIGKVKGESITVPVAAELHGKVVWRSWWDRMTGFVRPDGTDFYGDDDEAGAALAAYADQVSSGGRLLLPIVEQMRARPGEAAAAWSDKRSLGQRDNGWGRQWLCPDCDRGQVECHSCSGKGRRKCVYCDWNGQQACSYCHGKGSRWEQDSQGRSVSVRCSHCNGGTVACTVCYSAAGPGMARCAACGGNGTLTCSPCRGTGGFTALGSVAFELQGTESKVAATGCPSEAAALARKPLSVLGTAPGANVRLLRVNSQGRDLAAVLELDLVLEQVEMPVAGSDSPAWAMAAFHHGFVVHNDFLMDRLSRHLVAGTAFVGMAGAERSLREARATRVGASLLRLAVEKGADKAGDGKAREARLMATLHQGDRPFIQAGDLTPWRDGLQGAYAMIPADVITRQWRAALPVLLGFAAVLPLTPLPGMAAFWAGEHVEAATVAIGSAVALAAALVTRSWVNVAAKRRLRQVVPDATAAPPQGHWPTWAFAGSLALSLSSGVAANRWPILREPANTLVDVVRQAPPPVTGDGALAIPTVFPGSTVFPLAVPAHVRGDPTVFGAQLMMSHLGLLPRRAVDGTINQDTQDAEPRLLGVVDGFAALDALVERLYPGVSKGDNARMAFLEAKVMLLGNPQLRLRDPGARTPLRHLPPVIRFRQAAADVAAFQGAIESVASRAAQSAGGQPASTTWQGSMPDGTASVVIETSPELARRDPAGCFGIRLIVQGNGTSMPAQAVKVCPDDMRRPG